MENLYLCGENKKVYIMTALTVRDFRSQIAATLDKVDAGDHVFIRRKNRMYTVIPVEDDGLTISPQLAEKMSEVRKEYQEGKGVTLNTQEEIEDYLNRL